MFIEPQNMDLSHEMFLEYYREKLFEGLDKGTCFDFQGKFAPAS